VKTVEVPVEVVKEVVVERIVEVEVPVEVVVEKEVVRTVEVPVEVVLVKEVIKEVVVTATPTVTPTATSVPPTATQVPPTPVPTFTPTFTPVPTFTPTATPVPPTATQVPPTYTPTSVPPTATPVPPTATATATTTPTPTATPTGDWVPPTISNVTPGDGTITNEFTLTISFEVTDGDSGISTSAIALEINGVNGNSVPIHAMAIYPSRSGGYSVFYTNSNAWPFGITDSNPFQWQITATDNAGNTSTQTNTLTIDTTSPIVTSASVGITWDSNTSQEITGVNTAIKLVFSEDIAPSSVSVDDFTITVDGVSQPVSSVEVRGNYSYLTLASSLASDAKPVVTVVGSILDLGANSIDPSGSSTTATPMN